MKIIALFAFEILLQLNRPLEKINYNNKIELFAGCGCLWFKIKVPPFDLIIRCLHRIVLINNLSIDFLGGSSFVNRFLLSNFH